MQDLIAHDRRVLDRARMSRDPRFDGRFFMAVTTTGIYCRPVCPAAPTPKSVNVRFFPSAAAAAEAGFRPCLRCRPEAAPATPAWLGTSAVVRRALRLIEEGALDESSMDEFAARLGVGPRHLHRLFAQHVGVSPTAVAQTRRLHFAKRLIDQTSLSMTDVALASGFGSLRRFNDAFRSAYARSPREIRRGSGDGSGRPQGTQASARMPESVVLRLSFRPPYDWAWVSAFLAARAVRGIERVDERGYARTVALPAGPAIVRVCPVTGRNELELIAHGAPAACLLQLSLTARRMFDLAADPVLTARALKADALLGPLVRSRPGMRIPGVWDPFECAVRAVLGQQVSVAAARTFATRLIDRAGLKVPQNDAGLTHLFPAPEAILRADLGGIGVNAARIACIQALARAVAERKLRFDAPAEEVVAALEAVPGIGSWTAQYIALRALGEPDAFPAADIALRRVAAGAQAPLTARLLELRAESWRPWRSYAVMHLWRAAGEGGARAVRPRTGHSRSTALEATQ
jgi:AraC family transcriptional regulator, regulatory protein of adaptative response / DNA-3-methyladenine glycosylase II